MGTRILTARYRTTKEFLDRYLGNLAGGGTFFPTRAGIPIGLAVLVDVRLPNLRDRMLIRGTIAWRQPGRRREGVRAGVGIEFLAAESAKRDFLLHIARSNGASDPHGKRRFRRMPTAIDVDWRILDREMRQLARLDDIGPGGAFIRTRDRHPRGTPVVLEVVPPGATAPLAIEGRIAWQRDTPGQEGLGVQFLWRDTGGLRRLQELVRRIEES